MRIQRRQSTHPSLHLLNNFKRQSTQNSNKRKKKAAQLNNHTVKADARLWITCAGKENIGIPGTPIHELQYKYINKHFKYRLQIYIVILTGFSSPGFLKIFIALDGWRTSHK
jgi:hypothetical protein